MNLGVYITPNLRLLYELNYDKVLRGITKNLQGLKGYKITWFWRVNALKMIIVPRLIYTLDTIPKSFFKKMCRVFLMFVWNDKHPRLAYDIMCRSKWVGLPDIALYYKSMLLVRILNWCHDTTNEIWVSLEKTMAGRNLAGAPWIPRISRSLSEWTSPLTLASLSIWDKMNAMGKLAPQTSPLAPLGGYPWFLPGEESRKFGKMGYRWECAKFAPGGDVSSLY